MDDDSLENGTKYFHDKKFFKNSKIKKKIIFFY